jgi:hypothetical protein
LNYLKLKFMKKITFLFFFLAVSLGYSQTVLEDFETDVSADMQYSAENASGAGSFTWKPNPSVTAPNTSANAAEIITGAAGEPWQNAQKFSLTMDMTTGTKTLEVDVYSTTVTAVLAKVVDGPSGAGPAGSEVATDASHGGTGWETLTFDFNIPKDCGGNYCGPAFEVYQRLLFFPLWNGGGFDGAMGASPVQTIWVDNIVMTATAGIEDYQLIDFSSYPNPTRDSWMVKTKNEKMESIQVFDVLGKSVLSLKPNNTEVKIDGSSLKAGIYFAQVKTASGASSLKLVKQ